MKNHQSRPTGSEAFPEVNAISSQNHGRERGRGRGRSRGRNSRQYNNSSSYQKRKAPFHHQKWNNNEFRKEMEKVQRKNPRLLKTYVINVVWKDTGLVPVVRPSI